MIVCLTMARLIDGIFVLFQALKRPEWPKEAQVGLELLQGVGVVFTTHPTDCLQVCRPTLVLSNYP